MHLAHVEDDLRVFMPTMLDLVHLAATVTLLCLEFVFEAVSDASFFAIMEGEDTLFPDFVFERDFHDRLLFGLSAVMPFWIDPGISWASRPQYVHRTIFNSFLHQSLGATNRPRPQSQATSSLTDIALNITIGAPYSHFLQRVQIAS
jgi:hypothetical protein